MLRGRLLNFGKAQDLFNRHLKAFHGTVANHLAETMCCPCGSTWPRTWADSWRGEHRMPRYSSCPTNLPRCSGMTWRLHARLGSRRPRPPRSEGNGRAVASSRIGMRTAVSVTSTPFATPSSRIWPTQAFTRRRPSNSPATPPSRSRWTGTPTRWSAIWRTPWRSCPTYLTQAQSRESCGPREPMIIERLTCRPACRNPVHRVAYRYHRMALNKVIRGNRAEAQPLTCRSLVAPQDIRKHCPTNYATQESNL